MKRLLHILTTTALLIYISGAAFLVHHRLAHESRSDGATISLCGHEACGIAAGWGHERANAFDPNRPAPPQRPIPAQPTDEAPGGQRPDQSPAPSRDAPAQTPDDRNCPLCHRLLHISIAASEGAATLIVHHLPPQPLRCEAWDIVCTIHRPDISLRGPPRA